MKKAHFVIASAALLLAVANFVFALLALLPKKER